MATPRPPAASKVSDWLKRLDADIEALAKEPVTNQSLGRFLVMLFNTVSHGEGIDGKPLAAAAESMAHLVGKKQGKSMLVRNVTRVLANWHFIKEGMTIPIWDGQPITADLVVLGIRRVQSVRGKPGYLLLVKLKTGLAAGIIKCMVLSSDAVDAFVDHRAGVSKYACATEEISGMEARAVVSLRFDDTLQLHAIDTTDSMRKHNRDLADRRSDPAKCFMNIPCNACVKNIKECPLAVWLPKDKSDGDNCG